MQNRNEATATVLGVPWPVAVILLALWLMYSVWFFAVIHFGIQPAFDAHDSLRETVTPFRGLPTEEQD